MTCGLACGITGLVGLALAISAWIMGNGDLREMDAGLMDPSGRGLVQAGRIVGMINCGLVALATLAIVGYFLLILTVGLTVGTK
jgi:hypothetical protein